MTKAPWRKPASASSPHSVPSRRRHLHPQLEAHGAALLYDTTSLLTEQAELVPVGITLAGWSIGTSQGPIGDSQWFDQALKRLEPLSQPAGDACLEDQNPPSPGSEQHQLRQLALPEMVFPLAHVVLEYQGHVILSFHAMDFLKDWSTAHQYIPLPGCRPNSLEGTENDDTSHDEDNNNNNNKDDTTIPSFRGVQVLQTSDASLWKQKTKSIQTNGTPSQDTICSTTFHYDWTYSSPYTGTFHLPRDCHDNCDDADGNGDDDNATNVDGPKWMSLPVSGMPMHLLTDQTIPILLFDQLVFVEDDLHDNGQMQYTIKVRVMPQCAYLLCQLFVRVDHVVIRVRETRWLIEFNQHGPTTCTDDHIQPPVIYRDVTWRECRWDDLIQHGLPYNVQAWTQNEAYAPPEAMAALAKLIQKLPMVPLPKDIPPFAQINLE